MRLDQLAGLIPDAKPTPIPGLKGPVATFFGYGLYALVLAGAVAVGIGVWKLEMGDKRPGGGGGAEPFKWIVAGVVSILLSSSLISILNGIMEG